MANNNTFSQPATQTLGVAELGLGFLNGLVNYQQNKINYNLLKQQNKMLGLQANQVINDALNQNNQLQENFNEAIGNLKYSAVRQGIKSTSGDIQHNIEISSKNLGEDQQTIMKNANNQADSIRRQQSINQLLNRANYKSNQFSNYINTATSAMNTIGMLLV